MPDKDPGPAARDRYELWLSDPDGWHASIKANSDDGYGFSVIAAAVFWMLGMQEVIADGEALDAEAMERTRKAANEALGTWSLTGFQMGACVSIVTQVWERGETVRQWWNLETQIGTEGEQANAREGAVLNPAVLSIGTQED